jgi:hypothetical protein
LVGRETGKEEEREEEEERERESGWKRFSQIYRILKEEKDKG